MGLREDIDAAIEAEMQRRQSPGEVYEEVVQTLTHWQLLFRDWREEEVCARLKSFLPGLCWIEPVIDYLPEEGIADFWTIMLSLPDAELSLHDHWLRDPFAVAKAGDWSEDISDFAKQLSSHCLLSEELWLCFQALSTEIGSDLGLWSERVWAFPPKR
jgi:hypothetical protein